MGIFLFYAPHLLFEERYGKFKALARQIEEFINREKEVILADIMTTRELAGYLKLHEITICKYAANGEIPAIRIGRVWRFDKEAIDEWIIKGQNQTQNRNESGRQVT